MAFIPTPDGAMAVLVWGDELHQWTNTLWYQKVGFEETDLSTLAAAIPTKFSAAYLNAINEAWELKEVRVYDMRTSTGKVVSVFPTDKNGTATGGGLPYAAALVVTLRTAYRGRSRRGRIYLGGADESSLDAGAFLPAFASNAEGVLEGLMDPVPLDDWTLCIHSTQEDGVPTTFGRMWPVTDAQVRSLRPGTQRRRADRP